VSPSLSHRFGVIDLGSNSVRILVVDATSSVCWKTIVEDRELVRLGQGLSGSTRLDAHARRRARDAAVRFAQLARAAGVARPVIFATAAVRDASNGPAFAKSLARDTGLPVRVLSDREEGLTARAGIARAWDLASGHHVVADLGGGSLEVVRSFNDLILANDSLPLGALRLTEQFGGPEHAANKRFAALVAFVRKTLAPLRDRIHTSPIRLVGSGGGFTVCHALLNRQARTITARSVTALIASLRAMTLDARIRSTRLDRERVEILVPALAVVRELMRTLRIKQCFTHEGALRQGLVDLVSRQTPPATPACSMIARRLLAHMPDQQSHSEHVRCLACHLFDSLRAQSPAFARLLSAHHRDLLEAGALAHDLGIAVHEPTHHIESEAIIRESPAPWTPDHRTVISLLCRFHRKQAPILDSPAIASLKPSLRRSTLLLIALLRSADALDRTHDARVSRAQLQQISPTQWRLLLKARGTIHPELKAWWKKGAMLRDLLGGSVTTVVS
jgi:exopolyphosphatase/guanosine-5'-triphosphate,3'-diphosphate pyrophosphatase